MIRVPRIRAAICAVATAAVAVSSGCATVGSKAPATGPVPCPSMSAIDAATGVDFNRMDATGCTFYAWPPIADNAGAAILVTDLPTGGKYPTVEENHRFWVGVDPSYVKNISGLGPEAFTSGTGGACIAYANPHQRPTAVKVMMSEHQTGRTACEVAIAAMRLLGQ